MPRPFGTLGEMFVTTAEEHPQQPAFLTKQQGRYQPLTCQEALSRAAVLARVLEARGVRSGDRVAILAENRLEWALTDYAVLGLGGTVVPIYPTLLEPDVEYILGDSGARGIVLSNGDQLRKVLSVRPHLAELQFVLVMNPEFHKHEGALGWHQLVEAELSSASRDVPWFRERARSAKPEDTASILYTSGTMGQPKGVILTHSNLASNIQACGGLFSLGHRDVAMSFLPLSHVFERMLDFHYFWLGVTIAYAESFEALPQNMLEVRPTVMAVVPRVLEKIQERVMEVVHQAPPSKQRLFQWALEVGREYFPLAMEKRPVPLGLRLKHFLADRLVFSKVRARLGGRVGAMISGAAPLSRELTEFFYAAGLPVYEGYGLTETSPVIAVNYPGAVKLGTVGRTIRGVEVRLDPDSVDPEGGTGREILVRGPNVTPGYYHADAENGHAFADGWFHTGDLGALDADGFLTITGRKKNLLKTSGGKFISPEKLENLFQGHPYISQVMILGDRRRFVAALLVPNFSRLEAWAGRQGLGKMPREELLQRPEVHDLLQREIDEVNEQLARHEKIRRSALLSREFTIEGGELSSTLKVRRSIVERKYSDIIEDLYAKDELTAPAH